MIDPQLTGRVVLITGASNPEGIGAEMARVFCALGAQVFVTGIGRAAESSPLEGVNPGDER